MKVTSVEHIARLLKDGLSIGIGGFGLDRKPMSLIDVVIESQVRQLDVLVYAGGMDVERLLLAGAVRRLAFSYVGLDQFGLAPAFRKARERGQIEVEEWSEWSMLVAWRAAAERVPFTTVAIDPATELFRVNPSLQRSRCPFTGREVAVVKAPKVDIALLHCEAAHPDGWVVNAGDEYADVLLARSADITVVSAERLLDDAELEKRYREVQIVDSLVDHVVLAPAGAASGSCVPTYGVDSAAINRYLSEVRA